MIYLMTNVYQNFLVKKIKKLNYKRDQLYFNHTFTFKYFDN